MRGSFTRSRTRRSFRSHSARNFLYSDNLVSIGKKSIIFALYSLYQNSSRTSHTLAGASAHGDSRFLAVPMKAFEMLETTLDRVGQATEQRGLWLCESVFRRSFRNAKNTSSHRS